MTRYGPSRGELWFRAVVPVGDLAFAVWARGVPSGPALEKGVGVAMALFGGILIWAGRQLFKRDHP